MAVGRLHVCCADVDPPQALARAFPPRRGVWAGPGDGDIRGQLRRGCNDRGHDGGHDGGGPDRGVDDRGVDRGADQRDPTGPARARPATRRSTWCPSSAARSRSSARRSTASTWSATWRSTRWPPTQLWTYNMLSHGTVIFFAPGTDGADVRGAHRRVRPALHGLRVVGGVRRQRRFATCQESRNEWNVGPQAPDDFMGPALWPADLDHLRGGQPGVPARGAGGQPPRHAPPEPAVHGHRPRRGQRVLGVRRHARQHRPLRLPGRPRARRRRPLRRHHHALQRRDGDARRQHRRPHGARPRDGDALHRRHRRRADHAARHGVGHEHRQAARRLGRRRPTRASRAPTTRSWSRASTNPRASRCTTGRILVSEHGTGDIIAFDLEGPRSTA
jgi:hypothetical protein